MATLNGKDIPQCVRCTQYKPDAQERTLKKPSGETKSVLCDACAAITDETYPVQSGRQTVTAAPTQDEPPAAKSTTTSKR